MTVLRVHKTANYTVMSNFHFKEKGMSLKAKGLLSLMLSLPDDWDYSIMGLASLSKDGKESVMGALKELEKFGYLIRTPIRNGNGHFKGYSYDIFEEPQTETPNAENPNSANPNAEKSTQLNTNILNTKEINNETIKDKQDKRKLDVFIEPNNFTKELILNGLIDEQNLYIDLFNNLFDDLLLENDFEIVRSALWYVCKQIKMRDFKDENGEPITNLYGYFKQSIESGIRRLNRGNPYE